MSQNQQTAQLGQEKIPKLLFSFSIPAIVGLMVNALYNLVDRAFIGNATYLDGLGLAGITIATPFTFISMAFSMLFSVGGSVLYSIQLGKKQTAEAEKTLGYSTMLLVLSSLLYMVICILFLNPLLNLFGATPTALPYAKEYIIYLLPGFFFQMVGMGLNTFIRADGSPKIAMISMLIGAAVNTVLDPIMIFVFRWGMMGAALATTIGQLCAMIWVFWYFFSGKSSLKIKWNNMKKAPFSAICIISSMGMPPFIMQMSSSLLTIVLNNSLRHYGDLSIYSGDIALSAMGIIFSLQNLLILPVIGVTQGAQPIIGYNYGARKIKRVKETFRLASIASTCICIIAWLITLFFSTQLVSLFNRDTLLLSFGSWALKVWLLMLPFIGFQIVISNYFQAVGKPMISIFLSATRQLLFLLPAILVFSHFYQLEGILFAAPVSDALSILTSTYFIWRETKFWHKLEQEPQFVTDGY